MARGISGYRGYRLSPGPAGRGRGRGAGDYGPRMASLLGGLADLLLPRDCAGCATEGVDLCPGCRAALHAAPGTRTANPLAADLAVACTARYGPPAATILLAYKERGRRGLAGALGEALAISVMRARDLGCGHPPGGPAALVSIPSTPDALARRGEDVAARLVERAVAALRVRGVRVRHRPVLTGVRARADQVGLDPAARRRNLEGAFRARRLPPEPCVVLVDDVVTTGATIGAAATALQRAGGHCCAGAVILATGAGTDPGKGLPRRGGGITVKGDGAAPDE